MRLVSLWSFADMRGFLALSFFAHLAIGALIQRPPNIREAEGETKPTFTVDLKENCFLKDGNCTQLISGTMHYIRSPSDYWDDRIYKFKAAGLNTIQSYIPWFIHEPYPDKFFFGGRANITKFITLTQKHNLQLVLRAGPYMDAEVDNGGLPWWLLKKYPDIRPRTSDKRYLAEVEKYFETLLPILKPHLYVNGGNIVSIQVENEYGSFYACDRQYTKWLRDLFVKHLGEDVLLFTVDGNSVGYLKCGTIPDVFPTVDFGPQDKEDAVIDSFKAQQNYSLGGPRVNSEFYPGWMDLWGQGSHSTGDTEKITNTMGWMWNQNASFNIYMFFGGTNFGYLAGAEGDLTSKFTTITTSYDYDAPLSEAGDPTPKYRAIRKAIESHTGEKVPVPVPSPSIKGDYGEVKIQKIGTIFDYLDIVSLKPEKSTYPLNVEAIDHPFGFSLYHTVLNGNGTILKITGIRDRAYVMKNNDKLLGVIQRPNNGLLNLTGTPLKAQDELSILIENQGRICFGAFMNDTKGLVGNVTLDGNVLQKWTIYPIVLERLTQHPMYRLRVRRSIARARPLRKGKKPHHVKKSNGFIPSLYQAVFEPRQALNDTFFDPTGWGKGQVLVNNKNLGRYWPDQGPQVRLYLPATYMTNSSRFIMFELEKPNCRGTTCSFGLKDKPKLSKDSDKKKTTKRPKKHGSKNSA